MSATGLEYYPAIQGNSAQLPLQRLVYDFTTCSKKIEIIDITDEVEDSLAPQPECHKIYPIVQECGVNLLKAVHEYKVGDWLFQYQLPNPNTNLHSEENYASHMSAVGKNSNNRVCFLGPTLKVFINMREDRKQVVFVASVCNCKTCEVAATKDVTGSKVGFDAAFMKSVDIDLALSCKEQTINRKLTFYPGVTDKFDMDKETDFKNIATVVYYCFVPLNSLHISPFFNSNEQACNATYQKSMLKTDLVIPPKLEEISIEITQISQRTKLLIENRRMKSAFRILLKSKAHSDIKMISENSKKTFPCHKAVLAARSSTLRTRMEDVDEIELLEDTFAVETLLNYIYFTDVCLDRLSIQSLIRTAVLAHADGFMDLMGSCCKILLRKVKNSEVHVDHLEYLYTCIRQFQSFQIVVSLKFEIVTALQKLNRRKRVRLDEAAETSGLLVMLRNDPVESHDLIMGLFRSLKQDK